MALLGQFNVNGFEVDNVYLRVERVVDNPKKEVPNAEVMLVSYKDSSKQQGGIKTMYEVVGEEYNSFFKDSAMSPEGRHIQERAYSYIKSLYPNLVDA